MFLSYHIGPCVYHYFLGLLIDDVKMNKIKFWFISFLFFLSSAGKSAPLVFGPIDSVEVANITLRLRTLLSKNFPEKSTVLKLMTTMHKNGSWDGIDYQNTDVLSWAPSRHLAYVFSMCQSFANSKSELFQNDSLEKAIHLSFGFWVDHNFTSRNWWYNDIGASNSLSDILVLLGGKITDNELLRTLNQMRGSYISQEGQNLVWRAAIQLKIGLVTFNRGHINLLGSAIDRIMNSAAIMENEIAITPDEGIQPDWSFHQHGQQLQFGNYGLTFAQSQVEWAWVLNESSLKYSSEKLSILRNYILKGMASVVWKQVMDISGCGRSLSPGIRATLGSQTISTIALLSEIQPEDKELYADYSDCLTGKTRECKVIPQNTYFWRSDFMVHRTTRYYLSVRTHSRFIQSTESGIGQNLSGAYLADGATYLYQGGKEYHDILPVWNWHRIPGTTNYPFEPLPQLSWSGLPNESNFVGGVSDGNLGLSSMLFMRDSLTAYKSWFFGPNGLVCLGTGITGGKKSDISTTVNQSLIAGDITVGFDKGETNISAHKSLNRKDIRWAYHDQAGYLFLQKNTVHVENEEQEGDWKKVYTGGSDKVIKGNVFNVWIDHGINPLNGSYAYAVFPKQSLDSIKFYAAHSPLKIIRNDTLVQALEYPKAGIWQAVFYKKGNIKTENIGVIETDFECLLMIRKEGNDFLLYVSTPPQSGKLLKLNYDGHPESEDSAKPDVTNLPEKITISLSGYYKGENCTYNSVNNTTKIQFDMPEGIYEGKTVSRKISKNNNHEFRKEK
jgi:chondroitin AC lyase